MRQGKALNDELRLPWLLSIHEKLKTWENQKLNGVFACSALKCKYRRVLSTGLNYEEALPASSSTFKSLNRKNLCPAIQFFSQRVLKLVFIFD